MATDIIARGMAAKALENSGGSGVGGTTDYSQLSNKPKINGVEIVGSKTLEQLGIKQTYTADDIAFSDGQTFQEKYDSGELKGDPGPACTLTEADKQEIVQKVLAALPVAEEVVF